MAANGLIPCPMAPLYPPAKPRFALRQMNKHLHVNLFWGTTETMSRHNHIFRLCLLGLLTFLLLTPCLQGQNPITTVAGTEYVFAGDGKPALNAPLGALGDVTLDSNGNPVVVDPGNCIVFRLNADGTVTVLAGNGLCGYSGDGGPATAARLYYPQGIAYDTAGNLYIADTTNVRIRMVTPAGVISTVAGTGSAVFRGDGGPATLASLTFPLSIAVDASNNIYIADIVAASNGAATHIRKITPDGTISTIAGTGQAGDPTDNTPAKTAALGDIEDLAVDSKGNLYLADFSGSKILKIDVTAGTITTVAGNGQAGFAGDNGPATKASLQNPTGVFVDSANNIYIADTDNGVIRVVNAQGVIKTVAGTVGKAGFHDGPALSALFNGLAGLAADSGGNIYATDQFNFRLRKVQSGAVSTVAGNGLFRYFPDGTAAANAFLFELRGVSTDAGGNIYVADDGNNSVRKITRAGQISTLAGNGTGEYNGDNQPAVNASLNDPSSARADSQGNVYIADTDNNLIRMISTKGTITTVAGDVNNILNPGYTGDNVAATNSRLYSPTDALPDNSGNLYIADFGNNRVRKVDRNGIITTIAGTGQNGSSGDNGPAARASLSGPNGLALDQAGNLYVADFADVSANARIRRIGTDGTITTFAGGGTRTPGSTPIPAIQAQLSHPRAVTLDAAGNVYFSDEGNNQVYEVSATTGNIVVVAGNGNSGFAGDGGPATAASLSAPWGVALDASGNLLIGDQLNNRVRAVLSNQPSLGSSPATLTFTPSSGGNLTDAQNVMLTSSVSGLLYTISMTTKDGGNWLTTTAGLTGTIPATIPIRVDPTSLTGGTTYQGTIVVTAPNANPASRTIAVTVNVQASNPPQLGVGSMFLTYSFLQGASASSQSFSVSNQGGGSLNFSASATTDTGGNWLSLSPGSGTATPVQSASVSVQADPTGLGPGTYTGTVMVTSGSGAPAAVPVTMTISPVTRHMILSQAGLQFNAVAQGGTPAAQSFAVINSGQGDMSWTAQSNTLSGGNWLSISPTSGTSSAGQLPAPPINVTVNAAGLDVGKYYGQIQVFSPNADDSPQSVTVILSVAPAGTDPGPDVTPTGLVFVGAAGSSPGSQNVSITNLTSTATTYSSGRVTTTGGNWFVNAPTNGTVPPNQPLRVVVQPDFTNLGPGVYNGVLNLIFGNVVRTVNVLALVTGSSGTQGSAEMAHDITGVHAAGGCSANGLNVQFSNQPPNSTYVVKQLVTVQVTATDNCGNPMKTGSITVGFSNRDPQISLNATNNGVWQNSWQPGSAAQVTMQAIASTLGQNGSQIYGAAQVTVTVTASGGNTGITPLVSSGVQNAASLISSPLVAPGGLVTVMGQGLADITAVSQNQPYPTQLGDTQLFLDNTPMALLYVSDGQINAQVPYGLAVDYNSAVNAVHQLTVRNNVALSIPVYVSFAPAQPGILTLTANGQGQGYIYTVQSNGQEVLADMSAPAGPGDTIDIYCTGLGIVQPSVQLGTTPTPPPLPSALNSVAVTIGGVPATVNSANLSDSYVGQYRVLATVPSGIPAGLQQVVLTVGNNPPASSPAVPTMYIHQ